MDVEQHRTRGVAHVRNVHLTARKTPYKPRIDRTEQQLSLGGTLARPGDVVQNPLDLRSAEVGVDNETRLAAYHLRYALALEFVAIVRRTAILPYDGIVDRLLGIRIPHDRRLALVRDADTGNVESVYVQRGDGLGYNRCLRRPYLVRVVLDPARARKYLSELLLRHGTRSARLVEYDGTRTARALIQSKNILFHLRLVVYLCFY